MNVLDVKQDSLLNEGESALENDLWYVNSICTDAAGEAGDASADPESLCAHTDFARPRLAAHSQLRSVEEFLCSPLATCVQPAVLGKKRAPAQPASSHHKCARTAATADAVPTGTTLPLLEQNLRQNEFTGEFRSQQDIKPSHLVPAGDMPDVPLEDLRSKSKCRLPVAGIRRHMKAEEGVALVAAETPALLAHLSEMFIKDLCEAAAACSSTDDISPDDFARAISQHDRFSLLME